MISFDLGISIYSRRKVFDIVKEKYPSTMKLAIFSMLAAILISIPLGILSAIKQNSIIDNISMLLALVGISMPNFWLGPLLILLFSIKLNLLPPSGDLATNSIIMPAITLGMALSAILSRMTRASMLDVLMCEYITTARAKGLSALVIILKHALRNAMIPVITIMGLQFGALLGGAVITEEIFAWPGIGREMINAIRTRDFPLVQGCILVIALSYVIVMFITDLIYSLVNPRIEFE